MAEMLHFPFGTFERTEAIVVNTPDELMAHAPASMNMTEHPERFTDHDGYLKPGCYDVLDGIEIFNSNPVAVNLSLNYNRYSADGHKLLRCEGIYCVTNNDGKWAIQAMSTIFTPAHMIHVTYNDSITAAKRLRQDHCLAYMNMDQQAVWGPIRQLGLNLSVGAGGASWEVAPQGKYKALEGLRVKGVKTRLSTQNYTQEMLDNTHVDFAAYRALWRASRPGQLGMGSCRCDAWRPRSPRDHRKGARISGREPVHDKRRVHQRQRGIGRHHLQKRTLGHGRLVRLYDNPRSRERHPRLITTSVLSPR